MSVEEVRKEDDLKTFDPMEESILDSVKMSLGIPSEYEHFDSQIALHLNTVMAILPQLGVGPKEGFYVQDDSTTWGDLVGDSIFVNRLLYIKSYVCLRVRLLFDPPSGSGAIDAMERQMRELEWRITVTEDPSEREEVNIDGL